MTSANTMLEYNFEIVNSVKYVTFLGSRNKQFKMSIKILSRNTALVLGLYNMEFKPTKSDNTGTNAIDAPSDFTLYLSYKGVCKIYGGDGGIGWSISDLSQATDNKNGCNGTSGVNGFDGGIGIKANNLILQNYNSDAYLFVYGGNGGMGGTGQNGQAGSNGVNAPSGWFWHSVKGDDGASGGTGGTGGVGGTGGAAIVVGSNTSLKVAYNAQYYFKGGDGGKGGTGGQGGQGGAGARILAVVHLVELEIQEMVVLVVMEELAVLAEMELMQLMLYMFMDMAAKVVPAELVDKLVWEALVVQQEPLVMMEVMVPLVQMVMLVQQEKLGITAIIQREIIEL